MINKKDLWFRVSWSLDCLHDLWFIPSFSGSNFEMLQKLQFWSVVILQSRPKTVACEVVRSGGKGWWRWIWPTLCSSEALGCETVSVESRRPAASNDLRLDHRCYQKEMFYVHFFSWYLSYCTFPSFCSTYTYIHYSNDSFYVQFMNPKLNHRTLWLSWMCCCGCCGWCLCFFCCWLLVVGCWLVVVCWLWLLFFVALDG